MGRAYSMHGTKQLAYRGFAENAIRKETTRKT
jgi:hypothetical protein